MKLKWLFSLLVLGVLVLDVFFLTPLTSFAATANSSRPVTSQGVSPQRQAVAEGKIKPDFGTFELKPGQELWIPLSAQQKKSFPGMSSLHIQTEKGTMTSVTTNTRANGAVQPNTITCRNNIGISEWVNPLWSFTITISFCSDGRNITYISPVHVASSSCCATSINNDGTGIYNGGWWGYAYGYYTANWLGGAVVHNGYEEIDIYGDGSWSAFGY
jgi:hypothetical protein